MCLEQCLVKVSDECFQTKSPAGGSLPSCDAEPRAAVVGSHIDYWKCVHKCFTQHILLRLANSYTFMGCVSLFTLRSQLSAAVLEAEATSSVSDGNFMSKMAWEPINTSTAERNVMT